MGDERQEWECETVWAAGNERELGDGRHDAACDVGLGGVRDRDSGADGERGQPALLGSEYGGSRPTAVMPSTVLVTELDSGELVIQGRPDGPRAFVSAVLVHPPNHDGQDDKR
jgi:hypothetical protein